MKSSVVSNTNHINTLTLTMWVITLTLFTSDVFALNQWTLGQCCSLTNHCVRVLTGLKQIPFKSREAVLYFYWWCEQACWFDVIHWAHSWENHPDSPSRNSQLRVHFLWFFLVEGGKSRVSSFRWIQHDFCIISCHKVCLSYIQAGQNVLWVLCMCIIELGVMDLLQLKMLYLLTYVVFMFCL